MFQIIRISGIATGVGFTEKLKDGSGFYSESICETLFDTGNDKKDAAESEKWASEICNALNKSLAIEKQRDELKKENEKLKKEVSMWISYKQNIDEALNSGDGVYRP